MERATLPGGREVDVERVTLVDSTNRLARARIEREGIDAPRVIVAREQSGGYGRHGRAWHSPPGGLWMSLAWPCAAEATAGVRVGAAAWSAIRRALAESVTQDPPAAAVERRVRLKWPNDVLIDAQKVCGCLCERVAPGLGAPGVAPDGWLIVGVGVNVNNDPGALPTGLRRPATSLGHCAGRAMDLDRVLVVLLEELAERLTGPVSASIAMAALALARLEEIIDVALPGGGTARGRLMGLSDDGRLVLHHDGRRTVAPLGAEIL